MSLWKPIPDWPKYEVSDNGHVRRNGSIIAQRAQHNGYMRLTLSDEPNDRRKTWMVHRIVALSFLGPPPTERHQVDHINGDPKDNRLSNLRWVTPRQNRNNGSVAVGSNNGASVLNENAVREILKLYDSDLLPIAEIARQYGVSRQTIGKIGRRRGWTHV